MKTEFTITKEQIENIYADGCTYIKELFPEAFESELEVGKWYKANSNALAFKDKNGNYYGFNNNNEFQNDRGLDKYYEFENTIWGWKPATKEEVKTALINEAVKRGYKEGNYKCLSIPKKTNKHTGDYEFSFKDNKLYSGWSKCGRNVIYEKGIWAEIIEEQLTIEQRIERLEKLNKL